MRTEPEIINALDRLSEASVVMSERAAVDLSLDNLQVSAELRTLALRALRLDTPAAPRWSPEREALAREIDAFLAAPPPNTAAQTVIRIADSGLQITSAKKEALQLLAIGRLTEASKVTDRAFEIAHREFGLKESEILDPPPPSRLERMMPTFVLRWLARREVKYLMNERSILEELKEASAIEDPQERGMKLAALEKRSAKQLGPLSETTLTVHRIRGNADNHVILERFLKSEER